MMLSFQHVIDMRQGFYEIICLLFHTKCLKPSMWFTLTAHPHLTRNISTEQAGLGHRLGVTGAKLRVLLNIRS